MSDLLPCPFCGGKAERIDIEDGDNAGGSCVICTACNASGNVEFGFKENFMSNWNRRAPVAGWQPIETAPSNTRILTCRAGESGVNICHLLHDPEHLPEGEWVESQTGRTTVTHHSFAPPTHWMPLPAAPVDGGEDA